MACGDLRLDQVPARRLCQLIRTIQQLQAARQPALPSPPPTVYARSPEEERQAREAQTARREEMTRSVTEIDAWLDRRPH